MARAILYLGVIHHFLWSLVALLSPSHRPDAGRGLVRETDASRDAREFAAVARIRAAELDLARLRRPSALTPDARLALARAAVGARALRAADAREGGLFGDWDADV